MGKKRALTVYRIRERVAGTLVSEFRQVLKEDALSNTDVYPWLEDGTLDDFSCKLFVARVAPTPPLWHEFLEAGFGRLQLPPGAFNSAVLVMRTRYYGKDRYFAATFGGGRHLLRPDSYERKFGLKVALNIMFEGDQDGQDLTADRVRKVNATSVSESTLLSTRQTNRGATFETFGVDTQSDLLGSVSGVPADGTTWGSMITGGDSVQASRTYSFSQLPGLCSDLARLERRKDYMQRFGWIDHVTHVEDPTVIQQLESALEKQLRTKKASTLRLSPPEIVEWESLDFHFSISAKKRYSDLLLSDYMAALGEDLKKLTLKRLKGHKVIATHKDTGDEAGSWTVFRCLDAELKLRGTPYLLVGGDFYEVSKGFLAKLDEFVSSLQKTSHKLPSSSEHEHEQDYNIRAAKGNSSYLLMDRRNIKVSSSTSAIEFCDLLSTDRHLIHVKRKLQSSTLSHLFAQGSVSADLWHMSEEFRLATRDKILEAEVEYGIPTGRFSKFSPGDSISPDQWTVVYAIVAKWNGEPLERRLPFFSKVNLRRHVEDLRRAGYQVAYACVEAH